MSLTSVIQPSHFQTTENAQLPPHLTFFHHSYVFPPDREGATACSLDLVRSLVITGSFMNALTSRSLLAHVFLSVCIT